LTEIVVTADTIIAVDVPFFTDSAIHNTCWLLLLVDIQLQMGFKLASVLNYLLQLSSRWLDDDLQFKASPQLNGTALALPWSSGCRSTQPVLPDRNCSDRFRSVLGR
jgi:hypothetical protein